MLALIDDSIEFTGAVEFIAREMNIPLFVSNSSSDALKMLSQMSTLPKVFLVDFYLGDMTGVQLIQTIRKTYGPKVADAAFVVLTNLPSSAPQLQSLKDAELALHTSFESKPSELTEIEKLISRWSRSHSAR